MKCDNIKLCKINILVSTIRTFDNRDKALICLPALLHNNIYTNVSKTLVNRIFKTDFSNHYSIFCVTDLVKSRKK